MWLVLFLFFSWPRKQKQETERVEFVSMNQHQRKTVLKKAVVWQALEHGSFQVIIPIRAVRLSREVQGTGLKP